MSLLKDYEQKTLNAIRNAGYDIDSIKLEKSNLPEYGQYQINIAMKLAKQYGDNPRNIALKISEELNDIFDNVNVQGPGFINVSFKDATLIEYMNNGIDNFDVFIDKNNISKTIVLDYGGANIAKELHVGHLRCNIGESIRRLLILFGDKTISDVHWGDWGTPLGLVIKEIKEMYPDLPYFDENYTGEYPKCSPVTNDDLGIIYPRASLKKKEDENYANDARDITMRLQKGDRGLTALWKHIVNVSSEYCKSIYDYLNCNYDYLYGESDANKYVDNVLKILKDKGLAKESNGALIMEIENDQDNKSMPPLILIKSDGAVLYDTTELATIYQRGQDFKPDEIWYFTDERQSLHFEQTFRGAHMAEIVPNTTQLKFFGFGTINGNDGKPFKTRDGGVMSLKGLIDLVYSYIEPNIKQEIVGEERKEIANKLTKATLKFSDLLPYRKTDYIFDVEKFTSFEGKTGIYILYTNTRIKSLLKKIDNSKNMKIKVIPNDDVKDILLKITELSRVLNSAYNEVTTSYICDFVYELCSLYNKFYTSNNIMNEQNEDIKESFIALSKLVNSILSTLLNVLAIDEVEKM